MKVLIIGGDAVEALEIRLREEGIKVNVAASSRKPRTAAHDFEEGWETYTEKPGYRFPWVRKALAGLAMPGGRMPEYVRVVAEEDVRGVVEHFFKPASWLQPWGC